MSDPVVLRCDRVRRVFTTYRREAGFLGILKNFFRREALDVVALDEVDLEVRRGEFLGLIGANGAGKTTLVKCLTGIIPVTEGRAELFGCDSFQLSDDHKRRLSLVMGQRSQLWWDLPPLDSFRLLQEIYQVPHADFRRRLDDYAGRLGVVSKLGIQLRQLSLGERMKMEIIGAFLHRPEIVFLDEPTIGLDLVSRDAIRHFLRELNEEREATIVLTSHDMEDIEAMCRRLVILNKGSVLFDGDLVELQHRVLGERSVEIHLEHGSPPLEEILSGGALETELARFGGRIVSSGALTLTISVPAEQTQGLVQQLFGLLQVRDLSIERQPLEHLIRDLFRSANELPRGEAESA